MIRDAKVINRHYLLCEQMRTTTCMRLFCNDGYIQHRGPKDRPQTLMHAGHVASHVLAMCWAQVCSSQVAVYSSATSTVFHKLSNKGEVSATGSYLCQGRVGLTKLFLQQLSNATRREL